MNGKVTYFKCDRIHVLAEVKLVPLCSQVDLGGDNGYFAVNPRRA